MYGLFANQTENRPSLVWLLIGSAITGIVVTSVQYWVILGVSISSYWGALLGGVGAVVYLAFKHPRRGKEDPDREDRFQQAIKYQGCRNEDTSEENQDGGQSLSEAGSLGTSLNEIRE